MNKDKVSQIISCFSEKRLQNLRAFADSSYINNEIYVTKLLEYLVSNKYLSIKNEEIFQHLYPDEKYSDSRIRYLKSRLFSLVKKFFAVEKLLKSEDEIEISTLENLRDLKQEHLYQKEESFILKKYNGENIPKSNFYLNHYLFELERMHFYASKKRTDPSYLQNMHYYLDSYYFIEKIKTACTSINQQKLYNTNIEKGFFNPLIEYITETKLHQKNPLLNVYLQAYKMLEQADEIYFAELKKLLESFAFDNTEIKDAFLLAINYCIQQINNGNEKFNLQIFELYQTGIKKGVLLELGQLSYITYSNVVTLGVTLKRFEETEIFIEENKELLPLKDRQGYYLFNLAKLFFEKGQIEKVSALFNEQHLREILLNIQMRILQLKAFYELSEYELCDNLLQNIDQLLNRKGILAYHKTSFKNFTNLFKKLLSINSYNKESIENLVGLIQKSNPLINKEWLLKKVSQLK